MSDAETFEFDAIVVGSGITGGWAAKELTEKGLKVLVLDRGRPIEHGKGYLGENTPPWKIPLGGLPLRKLYAEEYAIQSRSHAFNETTRHFWNNDKDNPYIYDAEQPFHWFRSDVVGGRSLLWNGQTYRMYAEDFTANKDDGYGIDWPIRYADLAPWYDYVERFAGISGQKENCATLPDGEFLPPFSMNCVEQYFKQRIESCFPGRCVTIGRVAALTVPKAGRAACHLCGHCHRGCSSGALFSSLSATLPAAEKTGLMTLRPLSIVESLEYDAAAQRVIGVKVIDVNTREKMLFRGRMIFLCASAIGSTQIMLNSRSPSFPNGIANRSGALGHYLMDHITHGGAGGVIHGFADKYYYGHRYNGIYIPRFQNCRTADQATNFLRGYGFQGKGYRMPWRHMAHLIPGFGANLKDALAKPGPWIMQLIGFGECLPYYANYMELDFKRPDRYGIPQVKFHFEFRENERKMSEDIVAQANMMLETAGATHIKAVPMRSVGGDAVHEMGTACMGRDPATSVLNAYNQAHDVPNLFVTDGACMSSGSCVNPSLTYMAITARAADYAVTQIKAGAL